MNMNLLKQMFFIKLTIYPFFIYDKTNIYIVYNTVYQSERPFISKSNIENIYINNNGVFF